MSTTTTRNVMLPATDHEPQLDISIKTASPTTLELRRKVDTFIRASHKIWTERPLDETEVVAKDDVLNEVIHTASAFHARADGSVELVWLKKDMPKEALKDAEIGYWRAVAGPAARSEQLELCVIRDIPRRVMMEINDTNNIDLISHYLYPWIDFWCIVLRHWLIWLACVFCYGYLCILQPSIIVGESSKLFNLLRRYGPERMFRQDITPEDFASFLQGNFTLDFLQERICMLIEELEWDDFEMSPIDYIHVLGIPVLVQYGPLHQHVAIYIPKYHPYAPYHVPTLRVPLITADRYARLMVELARKIVQQSTTVPSDASRRNWLRQVRTKIMQEAARTGLLAKLAEAKLKLTEANRAFIGNRTRAVNTRKASAEPADVGESSSRDTKIRPDRGMICALGEICTPERKVWVMQKINETREQLEDGVSVGLIACPRLYSHGTLDHAEWLYRKPEPHKELINCAIGFTMLGKSKDPTPEEIMRTQAQGDATGAAVAKENTSEVTALSALQLLAELPKERENAGIFVSECPYCEARWIVDDGQNYAMHDCVSIRKMFLPILEAHLDAQKALDESQTEPTDAGEQVQPTKQGVTRAVISSAFEWSFGERLRADSPVFHDKPRPKYRERNRPTRNDPDWHRIMDDRGRLTTACITRRRITFPWQLMEVPDLSTDLLLKDGSTAKPVEGLRILSIADLAKMCSQSDLSKWTPKQHKVAEACKNKFVVGMLLDKGAKKDEVAAALEWLVEQATGYLKSAKLKVRDPAFDLNAIRLAIEKRVSMGRLRPFQYDPDRKVDLLAERKEKEKEKEKSASSSSTDGKGKGKAE